MCTGEVMTLACIEGGLLCRGSGERRGPCFEVSKIYNNNSNGWQWLIFEVL